MKNHIQSMHKEHAEPTTDQKKKQVLEAADTTEGGETIVATALLGNYFINVAASINLY